MINDMLRTIVRFLFQSLWCLEYLETDKKYRSMWLRSECVTGWHSLESIMNQWNVLMKKKDMNVNLVWRARRRWSRESIVLSSLISSEN